MSKLSKLIRNDRKLDTYRALIERAQSKRFRKVLDEVKELHGKRVSSRMEKIRTADEVNKAGLRDQSYRSRCVTLLMNIVEARNSIAEAVNATSAYIETEYRKEILASGAKTVNDRAQTVRNLLAESHAALDNLDSMEEQTRLVVDDIDKCAWVFKSSLKALELMQAREKF